MSEHVASREHASATLPINTPWPGGPFAPVGLKSAADTGKVRHIIQVLATTATLIMALVTRNGVTTTYVLNVGASAFIINESSIILKYGDTYELQHDTGVQNITFDISEVPLT